MSLLESSEDDIDQGRDNGSASLANIPLSSVKAVANYLPYIETARQRVTSDMEQMVINGLRTLVITLFFPCDESLSLLTVFFVEPIASGFVVTDRT